MSGLLYWFDATDDAALLGSGHSQCGLRLQRTLNAKTCTFQTRSGEGSPTLRLDVNKCNLHSHPKIYVRRPTRRTVTSRACFSYHTYRSLCYYREKVLRHPLGCPADLGRVSLLVAAPPSVSYLLTCLIEKATAEECSSPLQIEDDSDVEYAAPSRKTAKQHHVPRTAPTVFIARLKELEAVENKHAGTDEMISLIHRISRQKWKIFTLRYDEGAPRGDPTSASTELRYATSVLTRWELVDDMLQFAFLHQEVVDTYGKDYELYWAKSCTAEQISTRMVAFMQDVYRRGETVYQGRKPQGLIVREWVRRGTWETLSVSHIVPQEDLAEEREKGEGYPLRIW